MSLATRDIIAAITDAARRWTDADFPDRVRATHAIRERTGYTEPVVDFALDALFATLERASLNAAITSELGSLDALERFVARAGRPDVTYRGVARATIVSSDTTVGVAIPAFVFALCAGARVVVKDLDDGLVAAFARSIVEERPELESHIVVAAWSGADDAANAFLAGEDVVVAYGEATALRAIRERLSPGARFVAFDHRTSVGYVARATLDDDGSAEAAALAAARDALLYDGDGCLSLHALFAERGGAMPVERFAQLVARACDAVAIEFPAGYAQPDDEVTAYRRAAEFRAAQGSGATYAGAGGTHVIVLDPPRDAPPPLSRRTLALYAVDRPADALAYVRRHALPLEALGVADDACARREDVTAFARAAGVSRIARLGALQTPPLGGEHGGEGRILPFVRAIYRG